MTGVQTCALPILDYAEITSFIATDSSNRTVYPGGEGIKTATVTRQNSTWLDFDGVDDYLFIPDNEYISISLWVKDNSTNWINIVNSSDLLYEDNNTVGSLTLNPFKYNATGWYLGMNESGFFNGSIDTIKFYNDTMNESQVSNIFADGR